MDDPETIFEADIRAWPPGGGEMGALIRAFDWGSTPLGPMQQWPPSLKVAARLLLNTRHPMFIWWGPELIQLYNDAYRETMGPEKHPSALGGPGRETWAEIWDIIGPQIEQVMAGHGATWHEDQLVPVTRHGRREDVWWTYSFSPIDEETAPTGVGGVLVVCRDVTAEHMARERLRESEERYRLIIEEAQDYAIFTTDAEYRITTWPPGAEAVFGWAPEEAVGQPVDITFTPEDRAKGAPEREFATARASGLAPDVRWHVRKDGERVFIEGSSRGLRGPGGQFRGLLKIGRDVTDRIRGEEHQRLLLAELQHRVRNILAVVRSISRRTAANSETVEDYGAHLDGRLNALARTQAAVTRDPSAGVDLEQIVGEELLAYAAKEGGRVHIAGPVVRLSPKPAETLGLAVHELATNSVKYGALSTDTGEVRVSWVVQKRDGVRWLRFEWCEESSSISGEPPSRRGFGTELLERTLAYELKAQAALKFEPGVFTCTVEFSLKDREVACR